MEESEKAQESIQKEICVSRIDWDNIKITFIKADPDNPNPLNPYSHLSPKERREEIVEICAKVWMRHCREKMEKEVADGE